MFGIKYWPLNFRRTRLSIPLGLRHFGYIGENEINGEIKKLEKIRMD